LDWIKGKDTTGRSGFEKLIAKLKQVRKAEVLGHGANILGVHMEGSFLSHEESAIGAQSRESLRTPSVSELEQMQEAGNGAIRQMTIAPELAGAIQVIKEAKKFELNCRSSETYWTLNFCIWLERG
jgi:N-acetylglucosamine-6-phosphate deacetylase